MVDKSTVGLTDDPTQIPIERGKVREFARSTMTSNPEYVDDKEPCSPPTFLTTLNFWTNAASSPMSRVGLDLRRLLHGGQEYVFHGPPPRAGTELTAQTRVDKIYEKEGKRGGTMTFVLGETEFKNQRGDVVAYMRNTAIETADAVKG